VCLATVRTICGQAEYINYLVYKKLACGDKKIEGLIFFDRWCQLTVINQDGPNRLILRQFECGDFAVDLLDD
jgi:hypothetical protein